jgi:hypothetical protein
VLLINWLYIYKQDAFAYSLFLFLFIIRSYLQVIFVKTLWGETGPDGEQPTNFEQMDEELALMVARLTENVYTDILRSAVRHPGVQGA